jgi:hypothetical protein
MLANVIDKMNSKFLTMQISIQKIGKRMPTLREHQYSYLLNFVSSTPRLSGIRTHHVSDDRQ